jgi:hypothetical protein
MNVAKTLTESEWDIILQCLKASVNGPFFPDWEFQTIFGLTRNEMQTVIDEWWIENPNPSDSVTIAINNSINNLLGYPHGKDDLWNDYISISQAELRSIFNKWRELKDFS